MLTFCVQAQPVESVALSRWNFFIDVIDPKTNTLNRDKPWFIAFCANAACSGLGEAWDDNLKTLEYIHFGKVDCNEKMSKQICYEFEIDDLPTLIYFPNKVGSHGKMVKFIRPISKVRI